MPNIVLLPGDGIGPEIIDSAKQVLTLIDSTFNLNFTFTSLPLGGCAIDQFNNPFPQATLEGCKNADAILLGAVGGPKWSNVPSTKENPNPPRPEQGLLQLRKSLNLFANIRPCIFPAKSLLKLSPLKESLVNDVSFIVVRELTGGIYFGKRQEADYDPASNQNEDEVIAWDTMEYSVSEIKRITRIAAQIASLSSPPLPITSVDKANVLASSRLWRKVVTDTITKEFPQLTLNHQLVDSAAMIMVKSPRQLNGVVLTENMFGDILSDESSVIPGSLGLLPSASLCGWGGKSVGVYEPIHGSAPDIAGKGIANPIGTILSAALMLKYSLDLPLYATAIEKAVEKSFDVDNLLPKDLGGDHNTKDITDVILKNLKVELDLLK